MLLPVKRIACKLVDGTSWFHGLDKAHNVSSPLGVFQERHAAEVRRNKELQVELSG